MAQRDEIIKQLTRHLVDEHMTWSIEDCLPPTLRPNIKCEVLVTTLVDYMLGVGYTTNGD